MTMTLTAPSPSRVEQAAAGITEAETAASSPLQSSSQTRGARRERRLPGLTVASDPGQKSDSCSSSQRTR